MVRIVLAALAVTLLVGSAQAQDRIRLGYGRLLVNDGIGDTFDRWRTGSIASSRVWGPEWTGRLPDGFGQLLEFRLSGEIISPASLSAPSPLDRPYAGALSAGIHTHFATSFADVSLGADLVVTGPVTQLSHLQTIFHDFLNVRTPSDAVEDAQIENGVHPTLVFEAGRDFRLSEGTAIRPFVEARAGIETYARAGFDLTFGSAGQGEFLVREAASGQRYRVIRSDWSGRSFVLGADIAHVESSAFLPDDRGIALEETRERYRAGIHFQSRSGFGGFYGVTYLSEEFENQPEGQLVGAVRVQWRF